MADTAEVGGFGFGEERSSVEKCRTRLEYPAQWYEKVRLATMARCRAPREDRRTDETLAGGMMSDFGDTRDGKVILEPGERGRHVVVGRSKGVAGFVIDSSVLRNFYCFSGIGSRGKET